MGMDEEFACRCLTNSVDDRMLLQRLFELRPHLERIPHTESGEQLRKSCDYCARMKRACDGQVPCALCCRRGKTCERSVRRKSGPAKGAKYAPRRSKLEKQTAAAADVNVSGTAGTTPGGKAKNRGQGMKKRDVRNKGNDGVGGKTAPRSAMPRRQKQAKIQEEAENPGDVALSSASEDLPHDAEAKQHRYFSPDVGPRGEDSPREARLESPLRDEANEKDPSSREKDIQRSVKKRKSVSSNVSASTPADPDSPRKKRVPPSGVSAEETERRTESNRPEIMGASAPASSSTERHCVFPGERDGTTNVGPRERTTVANEDEQFRRSHHNQQQQLKRDPWQQGASVEESQRKSDGAMKQIVGECERLQGARAIEAAPTVSEVNEGSGVRKYPATVSPTREDEGLPGWEEPPPRVRAWEPTMERRDIDAYYRQYSGIGAQLGRVKPGHPQPQQDQAVPLAPKELLMMLRPNDKDIIDVIIDDKRAIAKKESAPPLEAASSRGSPNAVAVPAQVQVPRIVSSSNNGSSDLQAREQARELLAKIRRDAEAQAKAAHDDELTPKSAAIVSPGARPISGVNGSSNGPTGRDQAGEAMAHDIRRPVGVEPACRDRPQDWTGPKGFCRTLPPLQRDRGVFHGYGKDREHVGSESSRTRLDVGNGGGDGGGRGHNDRERPPAAPAFGPRDLVEGCLVPEKTEGGMRGRDAEIGEGGYWRSPQPRTTPGSLSVPTGRVHVDYRGDRAGYVLPPFRENERKQALMPYPNRGGSWSLSIPQHPGMRTWPSAPIVGPPTLPPPPVVKTAPMHSHDPPRPRVPHGDFYLPNGDYRFSGGRGGGGGDGMNTGSWKGNMWSLGTLSERRSGSEFMHPRQERSHPELSYPVGDRPSVHEAEYSHRHHHRSWPSQQGHRDGWRGHSPVRVGPNARSYAS